MKINQTAQKHKNNLLMDQSNKKQKIKDLKPIPNPLENIFDYDELNLGKKESKSEGGVVEHGDNEEEIAANEEQGDDDMEEEEDDQNDNDPEDYEDDSEEEQ